MSAPSESSNQADVRDKVVGLGERSLRKSHYAALQRSLRELAEKDRLIRDAYSDIIAAITGGRLVILGEDEMMNVDISDGEVFELHDTRLLGDIRARVQRALGDEPGTDDVILAFSEGATNMLKHASGGSVRVICRGTLASVVLSDHGSGIDFRYLPKATLTAGFSTVQTLGMGFTLMLELMDRLLLCTDKHGTTLVLEKDLAVASRASEVEPFALVR